jgi:sugar/nucleoside kinase (ribokinase family)
MSDYKAYTSVDYLVIGHLTQDLTPSGPVPGGTVAYAALTAAAMGLRVGMLTVFHEETPPPELAGIQMAVQHTARATTFENQATANGRVQIIHHMADVIQPEMVPQAWRRTPIVHLGPIAHEIPISMLDAFPDARIGVTPQGWMRQWDEQGRVTCGNWPQADCILPKASAVIISVEDVAHNEEIIARYRSQTKLLVVTEGIHGARIYQGEQMLRFQPPFIPEVDATGAGDIFAATFFCRYFQTGNIASAARLANLVAAHSITRSGMKGPPKPAEVQRYLAEINEET